MKSPLAGMNPKQKRVAAALAGGGGLALIVLLSRRNGAAPVADETTVAGTTAPDGGPSTFADNGAATGQLATSVTEGLSAVNTALGNQATTVDTLSQQVTDLGAAVAALQAPGPAGAVGTGTVINVGAPDRADRTSGPPAERQARAAAGAGKNVFVQKSGTRAGRRYRVEIKGDQKVRRYESAPGKGDFGRRKKDNVSAGKATTSAAKATRKPAAQAGAKPKPKPQQPTHAPAHRSRTHAKGNRR